MLQSNLIKNQRNIINENDTIKAMSFDFDGRLISSIYTSGYSSIKDVINSLNNSHISISEVTISNETRCWYGRYNSNGKKL